MRKIALISIGLLLLTATVLGFASAETETTYYMYDNGEWRVCTGPEAILAEEAMKKETPVSLSRERFNSLIGSREPFWNYNVLEYTDDEDGTPVPTPTISPTPTRNPASDAFRDSMIKKRISNWSSSVPSKLLNRFR